MRLPITLLLTTTSLTLACARMEDAASTASAVTDQGDVVRNGQVLVLALSDEGIARLSQPPRTFPGVLAFFWGFHEVGDADYAPVWVSTFGPGHVPEREPYPCRVRRIRTFGNSSTNPTMFYHVQLRLDCSGATSTYRLEFSSDYTLETYREFTLEAVNAAATGIGRYGTLRRATAAEAAAAWPDPPIDDTPYRITLPSSCFVAGTRVATAHGEVAIETLREGDEVLTWDRGRREIVRGRVERTFTFEDRTYGRLELDDHSWVDTTPDHPVYSATRNAFVFAGDLLPGETVWIRDGLRTRAETVRAFTPRGTATVHNVTVQTHHTYFANGIFVHNLSGSAPEDDLPLQ